MILVELLKQFFKLEDTQRTLPLYELENLLWIKFLRIDESEYLLDYRIVKISANKILVETCSSKTKYKGEYYTDYPVGLLK